jgi:hypothetical protein
VEELAVGTRAHFVNYSGLEVNKDGAGNVLASARLREEGLKCVVAAACGGVGGHLAVGLDAVLEAEEFPARVTGLAACLANVDCDTFAHLGVTYNNATKETRMKRTKPPKTMRNKNQDLLLRMRSVSPAKSVTSDGLDSGMVRWMGWNCVVGVRLPLGGCVLKNAVTPRPVRPPSELSPDHSDGGMNILQHKTHRQRLNTLW